MPEINDDWKSLVPITAPVPVGTKCVVIATIDGHQFNRGQVVVRCETEDMYTDGLRSWFMSYDELAILPADYQAEPKAENKQERNIVKTTFVSGCIMALCNDGTTWIIYDGQWHKLPPIPQD